MSYNIGKAKVEPLHFQMIFNNLFLRQHIYNMEWYKIYKHDTANYLSLNQCGEMRNLSF